MAKDELPTLGLEHQKVVDGHEVSIRIHATNPCVIVVTDDKVLPTLELAKRLLNPFTFAIKEIAQNVHIVPIRDARVPVIDERPIHLLNGSEWTTTERYDISMSEMQIGCKVFHNNSLAYYEKIRNIFAAMPIHPFRHRRQNMHGRLISMRKADYDPQHLSAEEIMMDYAPSSVLDYVADFETEAEKAEELNNFFEWLGEYGQTVDKDAKSFTFNRKAFRDHLFDSITEGESKDSIIEKTLRIIDAEKYSYPVINYGWGLNLSFAEHALNDMADGTTYIIEDIFDFHI